MADRWELNEHGVLDCADREEFPRLHVRDGVLHVNVTCYEDHVVKTEIPLDELRRLLAPTPDPRDAVVSAARRVVAHPPLHADDDLAEAWFDLEAALSALTPTPAQPAETAERTCGECEHFDPDHCGCCGGCRLTRRAVLNTCKSGVDAGCKWSPRPPRQDGGT